jgi:hypothetical protein
MTKQRAIEIVEAYRHPLGHGWRNPLRHGKPKEWVDAAIADLDLVYREATGKPMKRGRVVCFSCLGVALNRVSKLAAE